MLKFKTQSLGHRVLIKPRVVKETESGILLHFDDRRAAVDSDKGTVVAIGPNAYKDFGDGKPWVDIGDFVYYAKYGAKVIKDEENDELYILCNDEDVLLALDNAQCSSSVENSPTTNKSNDEITEENLASFIRRDGIGGAR